MTIFGLYITRAATIENERQERKVLLDKLVAKYRKANTLWNKVISKLLWENHNLRLAKR